MPAPIRRRNFGTDITNSTAAEVNESRSESTYLLGSAQMGLSRTGERPKKWRCIASSARCLPRTMFPLADKVTGLDSFGACVNLPSAIIAKVLSFLPSVSGTSEDYATDHLSDCFRKELRPPLGYMEEQKYINVKMRYILLDWLVAVHRKFRLQRHVVFMTISIVDRYLSQTQLHRHYLQLLGVASLFITSKAKEIHPPDLHDLVLMTKNAYTMEEVLKMERSVLVALDFDVMRPTIAHFLEQFQAANRIRMSLGFDPMPIGGSVLNSFAHLVLPNAHDDDAREEMAWYFAKLSFFSMTMLRHVPSHVAAAAVRLSNLCFGRAKWPVSMVQLTGCTADALEPCVSELKKLFQCAPTMTDIKAVRRDYLSKIRAITQRHSG